MKTNFGMPENFKKGIALHTKTDGCVCRRGTDKLDEAQKTRRTPD